MKRAIFYIGLVLFASFLAGTSLKAQVYKVRYQQTLDFYDETEKSSSAWAAINYEGRLFFDQSAATYYYGDQKNSQKLEDGLNVRYLSGDNIGFIYNRVNQRNLIYSRELLKDKPFIIEESVPEISWRLTGSSTEIGGYTCQSAEGDFRGRTYKVWFTFDIPVPYGPWKLGGLPGLILEAESVDGEVLFNFASLQKGTDAPENWKAPLDTSSTISYEAFNDIRMEKTQEALDKLRSIPGLTIQNVSSDNRMEISIKK